MTGGTSRGGTAGCRRVPTHPHDAGDRHRHTAVSTNDEGIPGYRATSTRSRAYLNTTRCGDSWRLETGPIARATATVSSRTSLPTREITERLERRYPSRSATVGTPPVRDGVATSRFANAVGWTRRAVSTGVRSGPVQYRSDRNSRFERANVGFPGLETMTPVRSSLVPVVTRRLHAETRRGVWTGCVINDATRVGQPFVDSDPKEPTGARGASRAFATRERSSRRIARRSFAALSAEIERRGSIRFRRRRVA